MSRGEDTCWTLIAAAVEGDREHREAFARSYEPIVRAYFSARWKNNRMAAEIDDAVQELFVDCLRPDGALERFERGRGPGFRAYLYGVVRNVARRMEQKVRRSKEKPLGGAFDPDGLPADEDSLGVVFDRTWAQTLLREAARRQRRVAEGKGDAGRERIRLLRLRFEEGLPIREIARRWGTEASRLHHVYATARKEYLRCLAEVVRFHDPEASDDRVEAECRRLLELTR